MPSLSIRRSAATAAVVLLGLTTGVAVSGSAAPPGPQDSLPVFLPSSDHRIAYSLKRSGEADLTVTMGKDAYRITSEYSTPEPAWRKASNRYFTLTREIDQRDECILVRDTFTNLTAEKLPIIISHRASPSEAGGEWKSRRLFGLPVTTPSPHGSQPANPTAFGTTATSGLGLMPFDDVFQVHADTLAATKSLGLDDPFLVLKPNATHTATWVIVPTATPDYFAFVNAIRRLRGVNFEIDGSFAFLRADARDVGKWSDSELAAFIRNKNAKLLALTLHNPKYKSLPAHGVAFQKIDLSGWKKEVARRKRVAPETKQLGYFHSFIEVLEDADKTFFADRLIKKDGARALYSNADNKLFIPTASNEYGKAVARNVDLLLNEVGCDGIYWDEMDYSLETYHYGDPWDGVSADIDPKTMKILREKSSVALLSQPWRIALARRILDKGPLVGNSSPTTESMAKLHFPRFTETGAITHCARVQLYTPIALGDFRTEKSEVDAYQNMRRALDFGCVYYWYNDLTVIPTHPTLTCYMFPITPIELHEGWILGQERILTNRSGVFGWNDASGHEVHLFDDQGREQKGEMTTRSQSGKTVTELRLKPGWSAAIVRRKKG